MRNCYPKNPILRNSKNNLQMMYRVYWFPRCETVQKHSLFFLFIAENTPSYLPDFNSKNAIISPSKAHNNGL